VNGVSSEWSLGSALDAGSTSFTITNGSFKCVTYNLTASQIASDNQNSRTIDFGSGTHTLSGSSPVSLGSTETTRANLSVVPGTAQLNFSSANPSPFGNNQSFYNVAFTSTSAGTVTINGANSFNNLSFTGITSAGLKIISVTANQTITGTFTCSAGTNATMRHFVRSNTLGTTRTLTCAAVSLTDVDFRDITVAGVAAPATGTRIGDCKGNSGITFDAAKTVYFIGTGVNVNWGAAASWSDSVGGAASGIWFPLAQDTAIVPTGTPASGSTITINQSYNIGTIDMSARTTNTMTLATGSTTPAIYGNWVNGTGTTITNSGSNVTFAGRSSQTITSAGVSFTTIAVFIDSPGGVVSLSDAYTGTASTTNALQITNGTFDASGYSVTLSGSASTLSSSNSNIRTIAVGSGTWTIAGTGGWSAATSTNLTVTGTGTISLTSASAKTFAGGGISYTNITLNQGGAGTLTISGNNTFANITNTYKATGATAINFGTTTQTVGNFTAAGEAGRVLTLTGTSASSPATLVLTSGTVTTPDYLTITGIRAYSLTTTWYAGANSTNNGSLGWYFEAAGGTVYSASFSDTATGADAVSVAASIFGAAYSETATGIDAFAASGTFNVSLSDTATGSDAVTSNFVFSAVFSDTATGADTVAASASIGISFSDTATGADAISGALSTSASFSDTATGADAISARASFAAFFSDTATGADAVSVSVTFGAAFSDSVMGADTPAVAASTFSVSILDTAQALDTPTAGGTFNVSFSDAGAITDLVAGSYLWNPIDDSQTPNWQNVVTAPPTTWVEINDTQSPGWVEIQT
jgi:hypothetical protein